MSQFNPAVRDVVSPDLILSATGEELGDPTGLNPCPMCDSYQADAPEGVHDHHSVSKYKGSIEDPNGRPKPGDPKWNYPHCFKCGFRPGVNVAVSQRVMARQFAAFQAWLSEQQQEIFANQKSMQAPDPAEVELLKTQLAQAQAAEAELRSRLEGGAKDDAGS